MRQVHLRLLALMPLVIPPVSLSQTKPTLPNSSPASSLAAPGGQPSADYRLHLSDTLEIQLAFSPEYNETTTVQPDGRISLREADPAQVAGKTVLEAEALIARAYSGVLKKPQVFILLKDFLRPSFYTTGEVGRPGRYEIRSDVTLLQAISEAGGLLNERARKKEIVVFRPHGNGTYETKMIDIKQMLNAKGSQEDYPILPGDIIYVPQNRASKVQRFLPTANMGAYVSPTTF